MKSKIKTAEAVFCYVIEFMRSVSLCVITYSSVGASDSVIYDSIIIVRGIPVGTFINSVPLRNCTVEYNSS